MKIYGIKNCDTVKKARRWLEDKGLDYEFHDFRSDGLTLEMIGRWQESVDLTSLLNREKHHLEEP